MAEIDHLVGDYLRLSSTGGILLVDGPVQVQQKIIRRLLTSTSDLLSDLTYGAGIPRMIGSPGVVDRIVGIIRNQLKLEKDVLQNPPPKVGIFNDPDTGLWIATIQYTDRTTLEATQIKVPLSSTIGN